MTMPSLSISSTRCIAKNDANVLPADVGATTSALSRLSTMSSSLACHASGGKVTRGSFLPAGRGMSGPMLSSWNMTALSPPRSTRTGTSSALRTGRSLRSGLASPTTTSLSATVASMASAMAGKPISRKACTILAASGASSDMREAADAAFFSFLLFFSFFSFFSFLSFLSFLPFFSLFSSFSSPASAMARAPSATALSTMGLASVASAYSGPARRRSRRGVLVRSECHHSE
mmetsp:Transcript_6293/g.22387  ORF Transcript_6293/g.22387 Transcript_6293/m.22387 type:complete len:232 (+) Transcript_6293:590-1285(+)